MSRNVSPEKNGREMMMKNELYITQWQQTSLHAQVTCLTWCFQLFSRLLDDLISGGRRAGTYITWGKAFRIFTFKSTKKEKQKQMTQSKSRSIDY